MGAIGSFVTNTIKSDKGINTAKAIASGDTKEVVKSAMPTAQRTQIAAVDDGFGNLMDPDPNKKKEQVLGG